MTRAPLRTPARPRRALSQQGGPIHVQGDAAAAAPLVAALEASAGGLVDDLTHGFHTYPARMHPRLARELIAGLSAPGDVVLDPFCGSGTVLIEALVAGRRPYGIDLNPLALRLSEVNCMLRDRRERAEFDACLRAVGAASEERVQGRVRPDFMLDVRYRGNYAPHVLLELSGLLEEIQQVGYEPDQRALLVVFSALLIKFSKQRADTSGELIEKRIRKGLVSEFFVRKGSELVMRWEALYESAPRDAIAAKLRCGDARELPRLVGRGFGADLVLSSPPYGGTYDYARQHALRSAWFGFDTADWQAREIGSRRRAREAGSAARWDDELLAFLAALRAVLSDSGSCVLWLGDGELGGERVSAPEQLSVLAPRAGLALRASASQARSDARGGPVRGEHLLLLEAAAAPTPARREPARKR